MPSQKKAQPQLVSEDQILDPNFRRAVLEGILGGENLGRKHEAYKRHEQYKDRSYLYVVDLLLKQFLPATVSEMQYALSNISITRKVINKLAKVYNKGAIRTVEPGKDVEKKPDAKKPNDGPSDDTKKVEELAKYLKLNEVMKKTNRYQKLHKNTLVYVKPQKYQEKWGLALPVLAPFLYDVIPDPANPECPLVVILSNYTPKRKKYYDLPDNPADHQTTAKTVRGSTDGVNQVIADPDDNSENGQFIWWSPNFHFTTNDKGIQLVVDGAMEKENPIKKLPFVNFSDDQDGAYWAIGGEDLVEGATRLNALITHLNHVAITQGYGQMYMAGKGLPKNVQVGPNHVIQLEMLEGDPDPKIGFLSANPPVEAVMRIIEAQFALLLTTNHLSTSGFATSFQAPAQFASGIAMILDKSESIEDTEEQAQDYRDKEPKVWELIIAWMDSLAGKESLDEDLREYKLDISTEVKVDFPPVQPIQSEKEHLETLKARKDLALNTTIELIMKDNPNLTKEEAQERLAEIKAEKKANAAEMGLPPGGDPNAQPDPNNNPDNPPKPNGGKPADKEEPPVPPKQGDEP